MEIHTNYRVVYIFSVLLIRWWTHREGLKKLAVSPLPLRTSARVLLLWWSIRFQKKFRWEREMERIRKPEQEHQYQVRYSFGPMTVIPVFFYFDPCPIIAKIILKYKNSRWRFNYRSLFFYLVFCFFTMAWDLAFEPAPISINPGPLAGLARSWSLISFWW